ncbi:MAG: hypothetical protein KF751_22245 [Nitrospira sp.]|nr:hypothetical protein [Nitrospira sp.]
MATRHSDTEQAVLKMLQQHTVMMLDEVLMTGQPDFTWSEVFLAIDRLSRKQEIALSRRGSTYQLTVNR